MVEVGFELTPKSIHGLRPWCTGDTHSTRTERMVTLPIPTPPFPGKTIECQSGGAGAQVRPSSRVPRKGGLTTVPLKVLANVSETKVSVSPGPLLWSGSIKTLFSSKPNLTLASRALLCRWSHREFRSRWALLQTGGLAEMHHNSPLPDLLLRHWPAAANPSTGSAVILGPRPLPELL